MINLSESVDEQPFAEVVQARQSSDGTEIEAVGVDPVAHRVQARHLGETGLSRLASLRGHRRSLTNSVVDKFRKSMLLG